MTGRELLEHLCSPRAAELLSTLYGGGELEPARQRYQGLVEGLLDESLFPRRDYPEAAGALRVFSVPGRSELGGNHTDHNRGKVLAASIQLDAVAVVAPRQDKQIFLRSAGHPSVKIDISDLSIREDERGKPDALVRGVAAEFAAGGTAVGGFTANIDSLVLNGSGLSSSAAVEVLFGKIFDSLYGGGKRSALELARIGQKAENLYFGKPCGLMDQTACAFGGAVAIDFQDAQAPRVRGISFDPAAAGFALCIVDSKGSHADLTPDYAAIPAEMKAAAAFFGKTVLRELNEEAFMGRVPDLRKALGDRAVLRALHFFNENRRVDAMLAAIEGKAMDTFLALVNESGDSSWQLLQNIYSPKNPAEQGLGLALALTKDFLKASGGAAGGGACNGKHHGACRVHGGGFAGTIQTYLPIDRLEDYRKLMEDVFGKGALTVLRIRPVGATELVFN